MASRKHCLDEHEEEEPRSKRTEFEPSQEILVYNPTCLVIERTCLNCPGYTVEELRKIARRLGIVVRGMSKSDLVKAIRDPYKKLNFKKYFKNIRVD